MLSLPGSGSPNRSPPSSASSSRRALFYSPPSADKSSASDHPRSGGSYYTADGWEAIATEVDDDDHHGHHDHDHDHDNGGGGKADLSLSRLWSPDASVSDDEGLTTIVHGADAVEDERDSDDEHPAEVVSGGVAGAGGDRRSGGNARAVTFDGDSSDGEPDEAPQRRDSGAGVGLDSRAVRRGVRTPPPVVVPRRSRPAVGVGRHAGLLHSVILLSQSMAGGERIYEGNQSQHPCTRKHTHPN